MHYYKRNIGDYSKKAGRLSILQHGVYNLLIDACYDREKFPTLEEAIDWTWASTKEEIEAVEFVLRKFFALEGGVYVQSRIQEEIDEYRGFCVTQSVNGKKGGRPKKKAKPSENKPNGFSEKPDGNPTATHRGENKSLTTNQEPLSKDNSDELSTSGKRIPDFQPDDMRLAEFIYAGVLDAVPKTKPPNLKNWANTIRLMRERDKFDRREIAELFVWVNKHKFWRLNILSPDTLREKFARLSAEKESDHANSIPHSERPGASLTEQSTVGRASAAAERKRQQILDRHRGAGAGDSGSLGANGSVIRGEVVEAVRGH